MMNDKEFFSAKTQRHITYLLIYSLLTMIAALLIGAFLPWPTNDKMLALAGPLITGVYGLASGATGFWIAKQRYQRPTSDSQDDPDDSNSPTPLQTYTVATKTTTTTPVPDASATATSPLASTQSGAKS